MHSYVDVESLFSHHKLDLVSVINKFLDHITELDDLYGSSLWWSGAAVLTYITSDHGWPTFVSEFGQSVRYLTGLDLEAKASAEGHDAVVEEEIESLRAQVDSLIKEVRSLLWYSLNCC